MLTYDPKVEIKEVDNFFPLILQREIITKLFTYGIKWVYMPSISYHPKDKLSHGWEDYAPIQDTEAFALPVDLQDEKNTALKQSIIHFAEIKFQEKISNIIRMQFMYLPPNPQYGENCHLPPHNDFEKPHKNILYYVIDNDADTLFFDQVFERGKPYDFTRQNIIHRIKPKQGRAVLFDGSLLHAGNVSRSSKRVTLNINFT